MADDLGDNWWETAGMYNPLNYRQHLAELATKN